MESGRITAKLFQCFADRNVSFINKICNAGEIMNLTNFIGSIENLLNKNNTTTSSDDISSGLVTRVQTFKHGLAGMSDQWPVAKFLYPIIFVELNTKTEEMVTLGNTARRNQTVSVDIVSVLEYGAGSLDAIEDSDNEILTLTQNIENMIRQYPRLSQTSLILSANIGSTDYTVKKAGDETYNNVSSIHLEIMTRST